MHDAARNGIADPKQIPPGESSGGESSGAQARKTSSWRAFRGGWVDEGEASHHEAEEGRDCAGAAVVRLRGAEIAKAGHARHLVSQISNLLGGLRGVL